jgi:hypothetical protein
VMGLAVATADIGRFRTIQDLAKDLAPLYRHIGHGTRWRCAMNGILAAEKRQGWPGASDIPWVLLYSTLATLLILSWAFIPA